MNRLAVARGGEMVTNDQTFLEADASIRYVGLRTKPITAFRFFPWGMIAVWTGAIGSGVVALAWVLARFAV